MAGSALIGALRVNLGLDTAQFSAGLAKSQSGLAKFSKAAGTAFAAASVGVVAFGTAMGFAVKGAIDNADALSKAAQKAGVTTEALSRLAYAADFSDVSLEGLTGGLQKLSKSMADAAVNKSGAAATAFRALGVSVADANGKLRNSDVVFSEIADRFSRLEDGTTKTALAMQIFGKSGAEMIPLLNGGSAEIKRLADEADRLGITLSTKTGKDAERFNDTLTLIGKVLQGVTNKVMEAALPALQSLAQMLASPEFAHAAQILAENVIGGISKIIDAVVEALTYFDSLERKMRMDDALGRLRDRLNGKSAGTPGARTHKVSDVYGGMLGPDGRINLLGKPQGAPAAPAPNGLGDFFAPVIDGAGKAAKSIELTVPPLNEMQQAIADVGMAFDDAVSSALSGLISDVLKGKDAFEGLIGKVGQLGDQLIDMALNSAIQGLFSSLFGGMFGGMGGFKGLPGMGGLVGRVTSFAGGGYTGSGARSGGIDGIGGFPALLHPNETVIDHTRQGVDDRPIYQVTINAPNSTRDAAPSIAEAVRKELPMAIERYNRNPYRR